MLFRELTFSSASACNRNRSRRNAHTSGAGLRSKTMRKGEPKTSLGLARNAFFEMLEARSCHTLLVRLPAHCRRATPLQAQSSLDCIPRFASIQGAQTIQGGLQQSNLNRRLEFPFAATSPGGRLMGLRSTVQKMNRHVGAWGKSVPGKLAGVNGKPLLTAKSLSATTV